MFAPSFIQSEHECDIDATLDIEYGLDIAAEL